MESNDLQAFSRRSNVKGWVGLGPFWLLLVACSPAAPTAPPPVTEPGRASAPPAEESQTAVAPPPEPPNVAPARAEAVPENRPAILAIHELCLAMCEKLKPKCADNAFQNCRVNCTKYDPPPSGCDEVVRNALTCARDASDVVCANVAPESCAKKFRDISACASGQKPSNQGPDATTAALPVGFTLFESAHEGISAPMPGPLANNTNEATVLASSSHSDGGVYSIRKLPRPPEKRLTERVFLKIAMSLLGRCSDKMKMKGMVDKPGRTSIHYNTKCPDGSEEQGLFWATDAALFLASVRGAPGKLGPADAFLYGFEAK